MRPILNWALNVLKENINIIESAAKFEVKEESSKLVNRIDHFTPPQNSPGCKTSPLVSIDMETIKANLEEIKTDIVDFVTLPEELQIEANCSFYIERWKIAATIGCIIGVCVYLKLK